MLHTVVNNSGDLEAKKVLDQYIRDVYNTGVGSNRTMKYRKAYGEDEALMNVLNFIDIIYNVSELGATAEA
jgi:hypothetical protein